MYGVGVAACVSLAFWSQGSVQADEWSRKLLETRIIDGYEWAPAALGCEVDLEPEFSWEGKAEGECGAPIARPLLMIKYGAVLTLTVDDVPPSSGTPGAVVRGTVRACAPSRPPSAAEVASGSVGVAGPAPWTLADCQAAEVNLVARVVVAGGGVAAAVVAPAHGDGVCAWSVRGPVPPSPTATEASLEVTVAGLAQSTDPAVAETCGEMKDRNVTDLRATLHAYGSTDAQVRGSPFMSCCDRCRLYDWCDFYEETPPATDRGCLLFAAPAGAGRHPEWSEGDDADVRSWRAAAEGRWIGIDAVPRTLDPTRPAKPPSVGFKKAEPWAPYLGGNARANRGITHACRSELAMVKGSPATFSITAANRSVPAALCARADLNSGAGWWVARALAHSSAPCSPKTDDVSCYAAGLVGHEHLSYPTPDDYQHGLLWEPWAENGAPCKLRYANRGELQTGQQKGAKFPTSKAHISAVFHSFG